MIDTDSYTFSLTDPLYVNRKLNLRAPVFRRLLSDFWRRCFAVDDELMPRFFRALDTAINRLARFIGRDGTSDEMPSAGISQVRDCFSERALQLRYARF